MVNKYFYLSALVALTLASCSSDGLLSDYESTTPDKVTNDDGQQAITFSTSSRPLTRATTTGSAAAAILGNKFTVYGTKTINGAVSTVFSDYTVDYFNSEWTYSAGPNRGSQTIRYWDNSASQYDFKAWTYLGSGPSPVSRTGNNIVLSPSSAADLANIYVSDQTTVSKGEGYSKANGNAEAKMVFKTAGAKVRLAFYEVVPGYSVRIKAFYKADNSKVSSVALTSATSSIITGSDYTLSYAGGKVSLVEQTLGQTRGRDAVFGNNAVAVIGNSTALPTYDKADKGYTWVYPKNTPVDLTLKMDYTLVSENGGEQIEVVGKTVTIPASYLQWKNNYAYTYVFKITDSDLLPITFSASVEDMTTQDNELVK